MAHVHLEVQVGQHVQHGAAEEGVLLTLGVAAAVDLVAEVLLVIDQIDGDAVQLQLFQAHISVAPAQSGIEVEHMLHLVGILILDAAVVWGNDSGVDAQLLQRLGQGAHHVGQAAGLGQRGALSGHQQHIGHLGAAALLQHFLEFLFHRLSSFNKGTLYPAGK